MKPLFAAVLAILLLAGTASAHTLYMTVTDNEDGTITVEGMYSTGAVASHTEIRLENPDGQVLFTGKTDEDGALDITKPKGVYTVIMDAGPGHMATEEGPR